MQRNNKQIVLSITLSGFFIGLSIVLQRFLVIPFGVSSLYRLSLGNVPIIMASLFLGPIYGGIVGAASDLLGATLFPVGNLIIWPIISSTLYGVLPWLLLRTVMILTKRVKFPLIYVIFSLIFVLLVSYVFINSSIRHPFDRNSTIHFTTTFRIIFTVVLATAMATLIIVFGYLEKRFVNRVNPRYTGFPSELGVALLFMGIIVDVLYSSWWKMSAFGADFLVSVFFHTAIMFILLPFQVSLLSLLGNIYAKTTIAMTIDGNSFED